MRRPLRTGGQCYPRSQSLTPRPEQARDTRKSAIESVSVFYKWASTQYSTAFDSAKLPALKGSAPAPHPADDLAVQRAVRHKDRRVRVAVRLAAEMGLRRGEVVKIRPCVDLVNDLLGYSLIVHGKGDKDRIVPVPDSLIEELQNAGTDYLFPGNIGGHVSPGWLGKIVGRALPIGATMHSLRHRFATRAYERTGDLVSVQKFSDIHHRKRH